MHTFILNPQSRLFRSRRAIEALEAEIRARGIEYRLAIANGAGDATRLAREAVGRGDGGVVAVGGDGTIGNVLNGLEGGAALGIVPAGTCNDIARNLGLPGDWRAALDVIAAGRTGRVDVGRCGERRFLSVAGTGLDSRMQALHNRLPRAIRGRMTYVALLLAKLGSLRPLPFRLVVDGEIIEDAAWLVAVANTATYGGGMRIAPRARPDDGRLHVCVIRDVSRLELIRCFPMVYRGEHVAHPKVRMIEGRSISIESPAPGLIIADGELIGGLPASFSIVPQGVAVFQ